MLQWLVGWVRGQQVRSRWKRRRTSCVTKDNHACDGHYLQFQLEEVEAKGSAPYIFLSSPQSILLFDHIQLSLLCHNFYPFTFNLIHSSACFLSVLSRTSLFSLVILTKQQGRRHHRTLNQFVTFLFFVLCVHHDAPWHLILISFVCFSSHFSASIQST